MSIFDTDPIAKRIGPSWCFTHSSPLPCPECDKVLAALKNTNRCFDCKHLTSPWRMTEEQRKAILELGCTFVPCSCYNGCLQIHGVK